MNNLLFFYILICKVQEGVINLRRTYRKKNFEEINKQIIVVGILFIAFIVIGTYLNKIWPDVAKDMLSNINPAVEYYNSSIDIKNTIMSNLKSDFGLMGLVCICSLLVITFPALIIIFMLKGLSIGYTINSCILMLKFKSIKMVLIILFKNIIIIPGAIILALISLSYIKEVYPAIQRKQRDNILFLSKRYLLNSSIIILLSVVLQALLNTLSISVLQFLIK